jgi:hypothetical protein
MSEGWFGSPPCSPSPGGREGTPFIQNEGLHFQTISKVTSDLLRLRVKDLEGMLEGQYSAIPLIELYLHICKALNVSTGFLGHM